MATRVRAASGKYYSSTSTQGRAILAARARRAATASTTRS